MLLLTIFSFQLITATNNQFVWTGQGTDSEDCDKIGESEERTADGWIHWIVTSAFGVTDAAELVLGGSGSGNYKISKRAGGTLHFFTPYFDIDGLTATLYYDGVLGTNKRGMILSQFVISDYCPGVHEDYEELTVDKTVETSYIRTHDWSIDKSVNPTEFYLYIDGSGNGEATWTIDVTYEDYEDSGYAVSGKITIENTGTLNAVITSIDDVLDKTSIDVDCGVTFPYTLEVGETLTCYYKESGYVEGFNEVTVTTEREEYFANAEIIWGDPTSEVDAEVKIVDYSDLFDEVELGTVSAPNNEQFTYTKYFTWADYGEDFCGDYTYENIAKVIGDDEVVLDFAKAELDVHVQCYIYETAYAKRKPKCGTYYATCFPTKWGWTNPIMPGTDEMDLWAGAAQCDTSKGILVGSVTVVYNAEGYVIPTYNVDSPYLLKETHFYAGYEMFPSYYASPGQYENYSPFDGSKVYVIAHAVIGIPDPDFGP